MTPTTNNPTTAHAALRYALVAITTLTVAAQNAQAQQALGVPFVGRSHLSISVTELSRDGIGTRRTAVFGAIYGRQLNAESSPIRMSVIVRGAARGIEATDDGIVEGGLTIAGSHALRAISGLTITGAAGVAAVVWGQDGDQQAIEDRGRVVASVPVSAGVAYDIRVGSATFAPFVSLNGSYAAQREYMNGDRIDNETGWHLGYSSGVSVRYHGTILSVTALNREGAMPNRNRVMASAGLSW